MHQLPSRFFEPWSRAAKSMLDSVFRIGEVGLEAQERFAAHSLRSFEAHFDAEVWQRPVLQSAGMSASVLPSLESLADMAEQLTVSTQELIDVQLQMHDSLLDYVEDVIDDLSGASQQ